jgi:arylsulfatase A-like enzyme
MRVSLARWAALATAFAAVAAGFWLVASGRLGDAAAGPPEVHPSILLVTIDTLRADHTSAYGYARPTTPRLAEIAKSGVRLDAAYAPMAATAPSHASMFTSLHPRTHGLMKNGLVLPPQHRRLAEILRENGYVTAAFVSSFAVNRRFGFEQGFASYDDDFTGANSSLKMPDWAGVPAPQYFDRRAPETSARVIAWLKRNGYLDHADTAPPPFFLWVHFFDPHDPYDPPPEEKALFAPEPPGDWLQGEIAEYDAEVHYADRGMGEIFDALAAAGRFDRVLTIVVGDHGEGLMQHGHMNHGLTIYEEQMRVPFVFHWPNGLGKPLAIDAPVQIVDLAPTVLDLAGIAPLPQFQGMTLAPILRGEVGADPERPVYLQRRRYDSSFVQGIRVVGEQFGLRVGHWKYIEAPDEGSYELFDLARDPGEKANLFDARRDQASALAQILHVWAQSPSGAPAESVSPEDTERLRALGYVP